MDLAVCLNAKTGVSFRNVHTLYRAVITTYDVTLTCQSNMQIYQLIERKYRLINAIGVKRGKTLM